MVDKTQAVLGLALIVVLVLAIQFNVFQTQSIVSVSNINVSGAGEVIQAVLAVNQFDKIWFIQQQDVKTASAGLFKDVEKDVRVEVSPEGIFCNINLQPDSITTNFGLTKIIYWKSIGSYSKDVVTRVKVQRANFASGIYDESVGEVTFNSCAGDGATFSCEGATQTSVSFNTGDLGTIDIEDLGSLDNGGNCPDAGEFAVIQTSNGFKVVDKDDWINDVQSTSFIQCLGNLLLCMDNFFNAGEFDFPDGHIECPPFTSCPTGFTENINNSNLSYKLDSGGATELITVRMNKEFIGAVVYEPAIVQPFIQSVNINPSKPVTGQQATLSVVIGNNGDTGTIRVAPVSTNGLSTVSPFDQTKSVSSGSPVTYNFIVTAIVGGGENFSILAEGIGTGSSSTSTNFSFTIEAAVGVCGNSVCDLGEQVTCPQDCVVPTHLACVENTCTEVSGAGENTCGAVGQSCDVEPLSCEFFEKQVTKDEKTYLIDLGFIKLFETGTVQVTTCEFRFGEALLVIFGIVLVILALRVKVK